MSHTVRGLADGDEQAFVADLGRALSVLDPPPDTYRAFGRRAFAFGGVDVVKEDEPGLLVRGSASSHSVTKGSERLLWSDADGIRGLVLTSGTVVVELQSPDEPPTTQSASEDGSFVFDGPVVPRPYRLVVTSSGGTWATPWHS